MQAAAIASVQSTSFLSSMQRGQRVLVRVLAGMGLVMLALGVALMFHLRSQAESIATSLAEQESRRLETFEKISPGRVIENTSEHPALALAMRTLVLGERCLYQVSPSQTVLISRSQEGYKIWDTGGITPPVLFSDLALTIGLPGQKPLLEGSPVWSSLFSRAEVPVPATPLTLRVAQPAPLLLSLAFLSVLAGLGAPIGALVLWQRLSRQIAACRAERSIFQQHLMGLVSESAIHRQEDRTRDFNMQHLAQAADRFLAQTQKLQFTWSEHDEHLGLIRLLLGNVLRLTERIERDDQFRSSIEELQRVALASIADGVVVTDSQLQVLLVNPAAERMIGIKQDAAIGQKVTKIVRLEQIRDPSTDHHRQDPLPMIRGTATDSSHFMPRDGDAGRPHVLIRSDGSTRRILLSRAPIHDSCGRSSGAVWALCDVTDEFALQSRLGQTMKMESLGQLASGVAHDFNNVLTTVLGAANLLQRRLPDTMPEAQAKVKMISDAVEQASGLTRRLLRFARRSPGRNRPFGIQTVMSETVDLVSHSMDLNHHITIKTPSQPMCVMGDRSLMQNALMNLLLNARDAMPHGGKISIVARSVEIKQRILDGKPIDLPDGSYVGISVIDTGHGMSPEVKERLFEPFFTTKDPDKGTGMGLATVYGTVKHHGGCIVVESEQGKGTTFQLILPLTDREEHETQPAVQASPQQAASGCVLVADDEDALRELLVEALQEAGYQVLGAANGREALECLRTNEIDLILLDIAMPRMDGITCLNQIRRTHPTLPVIACTGFAAPDQQQRLEALHISGYLSKPYRLEEVIIAVGRRLRKSSFSSGGVTTTGNNVYEKTSVSVRNPSDSAV
jgi:PAS domain S-box-containing protein